MQHRYTSEDGSSGVWLTAEENPCAYCNWYWDEEDLTLRVSKGYHSRRIKMPSEPSVTGDFVTMLPELAKRIADDIHTEEA
jgi:hypothetical protein